MNIGAFLLIFGKNVPVKGVPTNIISTYQVKFIFKIIKPKHLYYM